MRVALGQPPQASVELVGSLVVAALHPRLAYLSGGNVSAEQLKLHVRPAGGEATEPQVATLHPSSCNSRVGGAEW